MAQPLTNTEDLLSDPGLVMTWCLLGFQVKSLGVDCARNNLFPNCFLVTLLTRSLEYQQDDKEEDQLKLLATTVTNSNDKGSKQKRKSRTMLENDEQDSKRAALSLTKPSYNLGQGSKSFRAWCRPILRNMVRDLMSEHNWTKASEALSVYLHATRNEKSIEDNEFKFTALLDVLAHLGLDSADRIKSVYDIWIRKNGPMKDQPIEVRFSVHIKFINWCLQNGNLHDAYQTALWLIQENDFGKDQNSNIIVAMTFYELWYSTIPKELLRTESDRVSTPSRSYDRPTYSKGCDRSNNTEAGTGFECDSDSVQNDKILATNFDGGSNRDNSVGVHSILKTENISQNDQPQGFYVNSGENTGNETSLSNLANKLPYASLSVLEGLDPSLFPIRLPQSIENDGDLFDLHLALLNDYYKEALKYLRLALSSGAYDKEVLHAYIQLLLVGGQVDEALKDLDKFCSDSNATAESMRIRDSLLKHFDRHNIARLYTYYEDILKKEPTCCHAMEKLITMHRNGDYSTELLSEMIGLHLDGTRDDHGTQASSATWKEFASCFTRLSESDEDRMSVCLNGNEGGLKQKYSVSFNKIPKQFRKGKSREKWRARWESWTTGHFSCDRLAKDIAAGDLQLLAYKAACASHIYGPETRYVVEIYTSLEKKNETDLFLFLKHNIGKSLQLYPRLFMDDI